MPIWVSENLLNGSDSPISYPPDVHYMHLRLTYNVIEVFMKVLVKIGILFSTNKNVELTKTNAIKNLPWGMLLTIKDKLDIVMSFKPT